MYIFKNNIKRMFRSKARLTVIFLLPILFGVLFVMDIGDLSLDMAVFDYDQTVLSEDLIQKLDDMNDMIEIDVSEMKDYMINSYVDYVIIIPQGFAQSIMDGQVKPLVEYYFIEDGKLMPTKSYIQQYVFIAQNIADHSKDEVEFYQRLLSKRIEAVSFEVEIVDSMSTEQSTSAIGFAIQFMVYVSVVTSAFLLIDYESNTKTRIATAPMSNKRYLAEHLLSYILVASIQVIITGAIFAYGLKILHFGDHGLILLALMLVFGIAITAFGLIVVTVVRSEKASYWVIMVLATPMVMLGGCYFDLDVLPSWLQQVSRFLPTTWAMAGAKDLIERNDASGIHENILILLTFAMTFFIISNITVKRLVKQ